SGYQYGCSFLLLSCPFHVEILSLKESAEERRRLIRDADDLVCRLTIEFEIELRLRPAVVPAGKTFELTPPQAALRDAGAPDDDAYARRLSGDPSFFGDRFGRGDAAACDETWATFVLTCKHEDPIAFGDVLATIHRLVLGKGKNLC